MLNCYSLPGKLLSKVVSGYYVFDSYMRLLVLR